MTGLIASLASLMLPPVGLLKADIFTKITTGPGADVGRSYGAAWGDYDNDGFIDLFIANASETNPISSTFQFLYHNNGDGTFSRITTGVVATAFKYGRGAAWGDYDNDGNLDLVLVNIAQSNNLFHNNGDGTFAEVNASFIPDSVNSPGATWVDYDSDGYLDLFRSTLNDSLQRLHRNNHDGTFTRITGGAFLSTPGTRIASAWADYNNDGRPDLFLPSVIETNGLPNYLWRNDGGGAFTRVGAPVLDGNSNSTAATWGDCDNDGDLDLFVSCAYNAIQAGRPNLFYRNNGDGTFTSLTTLPANDPVDNGGGSHGCKWGDYDNDGWLDLFVANTYGHNDYLYHNNGDGTFTKIVGDIAVSDATNSWCPLWGDYDRDGFLDLFVSTTTGANLLYHNNGNAHNFLEFRLIGTRSNRSAIGAKVRVHATINGQSFWQMREVSGGEGSMGQDSLYVHVGLGNATTADLVRIEWPSGTVQELQNVASGQFQTITEPEPQLTVTRVSGELQLTVTGTQGSRYAIETSIDLNNWTSAGVPFTVSDPSRTMTFPAPGAAPSDRRRFYRIARGLK